METAGTIVFASLMATVSLQLIVSPSGGRYSFPVCFYQRIPCSWSLTAFMLYD